MYYNNIIVVFPLSAVASSVQYTQHGHDQVFEGHLQAVNGNRKLDSNMERTCFQMFTVIFRN